MVKIEILTTPGCGSCAKVEKMLDEMKINYKTIDITKKPELVQKYNFMTAPGIVIDGKLAFSGVPSKESLKKKLGK